MGGKLRPTWHWPLVTGLRSPREKGRAYFLNHSWEIDLRKSFVLYNLQLCLQQKVAMQLFDTKKTWQLFLRGLMTPKRAGYILHDWAVSYIAGFEVFDVLIKKYMRGICKQLEKNENSRFCL